MKILILNGPNLNLVGRREPEIYGSQSLDAYVADLQEEFADEVTLDVFQSNHEGQLLDKLHEVGYQKDYKGVIFNAGALGHTSLALGDAIRAINIPVLDVHISNVHAREAFRQHSYVSAASVGVISGLGLAGYRFALEWLLSYSA